MTWVRFITTVKGIGDLGIAKCFGPRGRRLDVKPVNYTSIVPAGRHLCSYTQQWQACQVRNLEAKDGVITSMTWGQLKQKQVIQR